MADAGSLFGGYAEHRVASPHHPPSPFRPWTAWHHSKQHGFPGWRTSTPSEVEEDLGSLSPLPRRYYVGYGNL